MVRDTKTKNSKKEQNKQMKKREEITKKQKKNKESDSDSNDSNTDSDSEKDEMDVHELRKYIQKIFPSKHMEKKIKAGNKLKKNIKHMDDVEEEDEVSENEDSEEEEKVKRIPKKKNRKIKKKQIVVSDDDDEEWATDSPSSEEENTKNRRSDRIKNKGKKTDLDSEEDSVYEEDDDSEEEENDNKVKSSNKLNIIFTIGGVDDEEDEWDSEDEYDSDYDDFENSDNITEDEDASVSSASSNEEKEKDKKKDKKDNKNKDKKDKKKSKKLLKNEEEDNPLAVDLLPKDKTSDEVLSKLKEILLINPNDNSIKKCIDVYESDIKKQKVKQDKKEKKYKAKNLRIFRKIVRDKNTMNDFSFYEKLDVSDQKKIIKELREINKITRIEKPYRMTLLESEIPVQFKAAAMKKINSLRYMEPGSGEFYKIKNWVDTFMRIPFGKVDGLPISIDNGVEECHNFMENAQNILDSAVYGLNDAKMQIMQMLGQLLTNPKSIGTAIAIHGPPGTGKTSLVKEGISKILNRPFAFIALGGATDSSFLEGHGYTYEGSTWGKIVQILIDSKCMNPVIYFDELDKISETPRGEEIAGILTHLTDTSQNSQFHDKYFAEINFDLSKCLFIFSYNDETKVNAILKDRMYRIKTKGYSGKEKTMITNNYLLPRIREQVKFVNEDIIIPDSTISYIIETHCDKEDGVRNLKRCLEIIFTKLNLYRLMKPGSNLFKEDMSLAVEFPFTVTKDIVDKLIKKDTDNLATWRSMYL
uniref:ATPase AAA-type core domain-containing protein n=1 Tax=viral metagenome TaxID=1070528 RepID=A0A6C0IE94_9ZZZZ